MTQNLSRNDIIQYGLNNGFRAKDIDKALSRAGMSPYNPLANAENWRQIPGRFAEQGIEFGRNLSTLGGAMLGSIAQGAKGGNIQEAFLNAINSEPARRTIKGAIGGAAAGKVIPKIGTVGGALLGGTAALLGGERGLAAGSKDLVNALLSTYNTSTERIGKGDIDWRDLAQGAMENPLYSGLDILSFGGAKAIGKTGKAIASKTGMAQKLLPGNEVADLNRYLTNSKIWSSQNTADVYKGYNKLAETPFASRSKIVESIARGTTDGLNKEEAAIASQLKKDLRTSSDILSDLGIFDKDFSRDNTIAQYAMSNLLDTNLLHKDIMDILSGKKLRPTASKMFEDKNLSKRVLGLIDEGEKLYDEGNTAFLSQKLANTEDPMGEVIARHLNLQEGTPSNYARIIGRATAEQQGNVLDATLKAQLDSSVRAKQAVETFSDIINNNKLGVVLSKEDKVKYINAFRDSLKRDVTQDRTLNFEEALNNSGIDTVLRKAGKPVMYESLKGFFKAPNQSVLGDFNKIFKKNVLGTPGWSIGNRLGNWSLNAIEGVEAGDYLDVKRYGKLIPDALKLQTSYNSYLDIGNEALGSATKKMFMPKSLAKSITEFKKSYGKYKNSDKTIADKVTRVFDTIGDISNLTATPIFELEAKMEYVDRAANYIRQAKRYASKNKMKLEDVLKKSKEDKSLFYKLNTDVNKSLGDYFGRNYALPSGLSNALNLTIPFYRFPVQTIRTTAHAVANNPARFASNVTIPARGGQVIADKVMRNFGLDKDSYEGGMPYKVEDGSVRTMSVVPTPIGMVLPRLLDVKKFGGMVNPLFSGDIMDALNYKKFDKTPSSPRYTYMKLNRPLEAVDYKPTNQERVMFLLNEILGTTYNPYIWGTRISPQVYSLARGEGRTPFYNTMQPVRYRLDNNGNKVYEFEREFYNLKSPIQYQIQNPEGYKKTTPIELLGGQVGISTKANYPNRMTKTKMKQAKNLVRSTGQKVNKNRGK